MPLDGFYLSHTYNMTEKSGCENVTRDDYINYNEWLVKRVLYQLLDVVNYHSVLFLATFFQLKIIYLEGEGENLLLASNTMATITILNNKRKYS